MSFIFIDIEVRLRGILLHSKGGLFCWFRFRLGSSLNLSSAERHTYISETGPMHRVRKIGESDFFLPLFTEGRWRRKNGANGMLIDISHIGDDDLLLREGWLRMRLLNGRMIIMLRSEVLGVKVTTRWTDGGWEFLWRY